MMHQPVDELQQPILLAQDKQDADMWLVEFWFPHALFWDIMLNTRGASDWLTEFCYQFYQHDEVADWDYDRQTITFWFRVK